MADVWVAEDRLLGRQVAVKILHGQYAANEAFVQRFRREAQAAANLSHANIVAVYDWGEDDDTYFIVMELVQGRNLRDVIRSEGALLPRRVAEIGAEVCVAISAAHNQGLVHRDIKPANVLLSPDGAVKVADFGIARAWDDSEHLTKTGSVIGTASYFSPEQAQGKTADARSDIYSVGVVMYELLTGSPPFSGESPVAVALQHVQQQPQPPSELNPNVPPGLEAIALKAMAKDPAARYQSATEMVEDLDRLLAGQVPLAAPQNEAQTRMMPPADPPSVPDQSSGTQFEATLPQYDQAFYQEPGRTDRTTVTIGIIASLALLLLGIILLTRLLGSDGVVATVTVPELKGNQITSAVDELTRLGLSVEEETVSSADVAEGIVIGTEPTAGTEVESGSLITLIISGGSTTVQVPAVIDLTEDQARTAIELTGLEVGEFVFETSPVVEVGTVMAQEPEAGTPVAPGTRVDLVVSAGLNALTLPDVVGRSESDALFVLSQGGFEVGQIRIDRRPSAEVLEGFVIETNPEAEQLVSNDGFVTIVISQGAVPSVVASVLTQDPDVAAQILEDLGFVVVFDDPLELEWDDPLDGVVAEQSPAGGETSEFGATIRLRIGEAATEAAAPDVLGNDEETARQTIEDLGLVFSRGPDINLGIGDAANGTAMEQTPPPEELIAIGSTMTVRFGVASVAVPDLIGDLATTCLSQEEADAVVIAAGLVPRRLEDAPVPFGHPCNGLVFQQFPEALSALPPGSFVDYSIGIIDPEVTLAVGTVVGVDLATAQASYPSLTFVLASECHELGAVGTLIRVINPSEGNTIASDATVTYWIAVDNDTLGLCTDVP